MGDGVEVVDVVFVLDVGGEGGLGVMFEVSPGV